MKGKLLEVLDLCFRLKERDIETMFTYYSNAGFYSLNLSLPNKHIRFFEGIDDIEKLNETTEYLLNLLLEDKK